MNSKKVGSTGPFQTNPLYRSLSKGDVTTGSSSSEKKSADYNHFDLFGEPQDLDGTENLSIQTNYQNTDTSSVETSTAKIHFDDFADDFDSHIEGADANSSSEEPAPTPVSPPKVPPAPVQLAPQFSDDPAIAALQKSQHENTKNVVLYTELLQILNQALIDNPTLPKNSFDFIKGIFNQSLQQCTARIEVLSNETQVALDEHAVKAQSLAAQAAGGSTSVNHDGTFSITSPQRITSAELDQLRTEVERIDEPDLQHTVVAGLQTALQEMGMITDEQLDQLMLDMGGETEGTRRQQADDMAALDKGLEQLANLQEAMEDSVDWDQHLCAPDEANMAAIKKQVEAEENEKSAAHLAELAHERNAKVADLLRQFDANLEQETSSAEHDSSFGTPFMQTELDQLLDDLGDVSESNSQDSTQWESSTGAGPEQADPFAGQDELLAEAELLLEQEKQKAKVTQGELKPLVLSDDVRREIEGEAFRHRFHTLEVLDAEIDLVKKRQLTSKELKSPDLAIRETKHKVQAVIARYHHEQERIVGLATMELKAIDSNEVMADALPSERLKRTAEVEERRKTALELLDTMGQMIYHLWN